MAQISDEPVKQLLDKPNHAVISTLNEDGSIHTAVVWVSVEGDSVAVNSAEGRKWPQNLDRNPTANILVYDQANPFEYVEVRGRASRAEGADDHIDSLSQKYIDQDEYPFRQPGEERIKFVVEPERVRYQKQG
jgi:PPOX class probable F420-dependent enzyme